MNYYQKTIIATAIGLIIGLSVFPGCSRQLRREPVGRTKIRFDKEEPRIRYRRADKAHRRELSGPEPIVRIGIMEEYDRIEFSVEDEFNLIALNGDTIASRLKTDAKWSVTPFETEEARAIYSILTTAFAERDSADKLRKRLASDGYPTRIAEIGEEVSIDGKVVANNIKYRVLVGRWLTEKEAKAAIDPFRDEFAPRIIRQIVRPATGVIDIKDDRSEYAFKVENGFRIVPCNKDCSVMLYDVREGTGFHWEREVDRKYPGIVDIRIDHRALLMAFTEVALETYLKGVVPSEMPASYPLEALKAQAIAARSEVLAKLGAKHPNDPFDLCANVHCQAYTGCTNLDPRASQAVDETRGQVLTLGGMVAEAVYSSTCGGHSEDKINVWNPPDAPHLKGKIDTSDEILNNPAENNPSSNLTTEKGIAQWINSKPKVWCNVDAFPNLPSVLSKNSDNFRWEVVYSRRELEDIIKRKTGEDIGQLLNIVPIQRGVSGRLMEIEIQGTKKYIRIQRELNIRAALSPRYLKSACFIVEVETSEDGKPVNFILKGAGWGHGVGMCQVGAGVMAAQGKKVEEILKHYYPGTKISKIY